MTRTPTETAEELIGGFCKVALREFDALSDVDWAFAEDGMLMFRDRLSDRDVMKRAQTDVAYRLFLGLGMEDSLPDPSLLSHFRSRLKEDGFHKIFNNILWLAVKRPLGSERSQA